MQNYNYTATQLIISSLHIDDHSMNRVVPTLRKLYGSNYLRFAMFICTQPLLGSQDLANQSSGQFVHTSSSSVVWTDQV